MREEGAQEPGLWREDKRPGPQALHRHWLSVSVSVWAAGQQLHQGNTMHVPHGPWVTRSRHSTSLFLSPGERPAGQCPLGKEQKWNQSAGVWAKVRRALGWSLGVPKLTVESSRCPEGIQPHACVQSLQKGAEEETTCIRGGPEPQASSAQVNGELPRGSCRILWSPAQIMTRLSMWHLRNGTSGQLMGKANGLH